MATDLNDELAKNRTESMGMLFLSEAMTILEDVGTPGKAGADLRTKSSLLGLLRTTEHFSIVRNVRSLHEGGMMGEGIVKKLRPFLTHGLKADWPVNMHDHVFRTEARDFLDSCLRNKTPSEAYHFTKFQRYKSIDNVIEKMVEGNCLSLLVFRDTTNDQTSREPSGVHFGVIVATNNHTWTYHQCLPTLDHTTVYKDPVGYSYFDVTLQQQSKFEITKANRETMTLSSGAAFVGSAMGLPLCWGQIQGQPKYAVVNSDGKSLSQQGTFV